MVGGVAGGRQGMRGGIGGAIHGQQTVHMCKGCIPKP